MLQYSPEGVIGRDDGCQSHFSDASRGPAVSGLNSFVECCVMLHFKAFSLSSARWSAYVYVSWLTTS